MAGGETLPGTDAAGVGGRADRIAQSLGKTLVEEMKKYNHQVGLKMVGEQQQPQERNRVMFPTVGGVNPSETIQAVACRTADRIKHLARRGEL